MDAVSDEELGEIERRVVARMVAAFDLDCSGLVLDMTNFATYIDSANDRAPIAQRGHAKQKRSDLRLVGLGLVVSGDGGVPLVSHAYAGNRHDGTQFKDVVAELVTRFGALATSGADLTVVYDAGQASGANHEFMEASPLHFVGSLRPFDHLDLLAVPSRRYRRVDPERFVGLSAFETRAMVFGHEHRVVITHSQRLHDKQRAGFAQTLAKARRQLGEIAARLGRGNGRRSKEAVAAEVASVLAPRWLGRVLSTTLHGETPAELRLIWRTKPKAVAELEEEMFGKRILFTDRDDWSIAEVVAGYRSQWNVEADFRQMKDPKVVSFSPMFHWTDHEDSHRPRHALRAGAHDGTAHGPRGGPGRHHDECARAALDSGRDRGDRAPLPRRPGPTEGPQDADGDDGHPRTTLRPLRPRGLRPDPLSWVIHRSTCNTPSDLERRRDIRR